MGQRLKYYRFLMGIDLEHLSAAKSYLLKEYGDLRKVPLPCDIYMETGKDGNIKVAILSAHNPDELADSEKTIVKATNVILIKYFADFEQLG